MKYRVLLCDLDDTLLDFSRGEALAISQTFQTFGIPDTTENARLYAHLNRLQWQKLERGETTQPQLCIDRFQDFLRETGYCADAQAMSAFFAQKLARQHFVLPGAKAFCQRISARMPIYLVTNGVPSVQRNRLEKCGLAPLFSGVVISQEVGFAKPDARIVQAALEKARVQPWQAVLLGDSMTADIGAARNAGVDSILFTGGKPVPEGHGATYAACTYQQAEQLILQPYNN